LSIGNRIQVIQPAKEYHFKYKGCYFTTNATTPEHIDSLENFEIRDNDVFLVTYPKSGTIWTQNILSLIYHEGHRNGVENIDLMDRVPWLEYNVRHMDYQRCPSPRLFASHLPYFLVPRELRNRRGTVIYVARNPKDALVSYFHFSKILTDMEDEPDFGKFMERFLAGKGKNNFLFYSQSLLPFLPFICFVPSSYEMASF
uniref:Sulfotransferase n=1 Tax=Salvator merianae TaxID=96440 RepID=A0A8D0DQN4_SALMN